MGVEPTIRLREFLLKHREVVKHVAQRMCLRPLEDDSLTFERFEAVLTELGLDGYLSDDCE
jgi:hypothetical protein